MEMDGYMVSYPLGCGVEGILDENLALALRLGQGTAAAGVPRSTTSQLSRQSALGGQRSPRFRDVWT